MDEAYDPDDEAMQHRQGVAVYPIGKVLRATYDADNHDTLSAEVTALMISLSRVPYEPGVVEPVAAVAPVTRSLLARVRGLLVR